MGGMKLSPIKIYDISKVIYSFSDQEKPRGTLPLRESIFIETMDAYGNQLQNEHQGEPVKLKQGINPATGPFFIEGASPGDTLVVKIHRIEVANQGTMYLRKGAGVYGEVLSHAEIAKIPIEEGACLLPGNIRVPMEPMIGVIGVAPEGAGIPTGIPGRHGGNMDTKAITHGAILYLPIFRDGGLFAMGDLHAAMGDGETGICGVEVPGCVELSLDLIKGIQENGPILENEREWMAIASAPTLDEAGKLACFEMVNFLKRRTTWSDHDIIRLLSAAGNLQVSQVVNPLKTARMSLSKNSVTVSFLP